jgi:hypothetical protein
LNLPAPDFTDIIAVIFDRYARCCFARDTVYLNFLCLPRCFFLRLPMAIFFHETEEAHSLISAFHDIRQASQLPAPDFTANIAVFFDRYDRCCFARDKVLDFLLAPLLLFASRCDAANVTVPPAPVTTVPTNHAPPLYYTAASHRSHFALTALIQSFRFLEMLLLRPNYFHASATVLPAPVPIPAAPFIPPILPPVPTLSITLTLLSISCFHPRQLYH